MNKTTKRILALLMTVTALLGLMVPAVSADTPNEASCVVTYNFDFRSLGGGNGLTTTSANQKAAYGGNAWNWQYHSYKLTTGQNANSLVYTNDTAGLGYEYLRVYSTVGDYVALTVKTPTTGTYTLSLYHGSTKAGASKSNIYMLPANTTNIEQAIAAATEIGFVNYWNGKSSGSADPASKTTSQGNVMQTSTVKTSDDSAARWTADGESEHILVFHATTVSGGVSTGINAAMYPAKLTLTPVDSGSFTTVMRDAAYCNGAVTLQTNAALQEDVTANAASIPSVTIPEGVTLDLNGKKLAANVIGQGKLTDSSAAAGAVISSNAPTCGVNANELLLKTETGYQIFDYTLESADVEKAEDGKSVNFWFDVRFAEAQATDAYTAIAAGNSGFGLTAQLSWDNGTPLTAQFGEGKSVQDWASLMLQDPGYSFYIRVTGLDSVTTAGTLKAAPKIVGLQGSSTVEMTYDIAAQ